MEVLIIDDDTLIHEVLAAVVRRAFPGWDIAFVTDLEAAFRRVAHHGEPDLALLDLGLPGQSGLDALRRFRGKFPDMPVVIVSASEERKSIRAALDAGAAGYLPKTLSAHEMLQALKIVADGDVYVPPQAG
jgi:DNA-binding NarL/FixJ family response regulator